MRRAILTALILAASVAQATPPRAVFVDETLLAETEDHLMVLRRVRDNLGFHYTMQTDVFLIARPLNGAGDSERWHVRAGVDNGPEWKEFGMPQRLADRTPEGAVDPFAVVAERGGFNLLEGPLNDEFSEAVILPDAIEVRQGGETTHRLSLETAAIVMGASLEGTMDMLSQRQSRPVEVSDVPISAVACRTVGHYSYPISIEPFRPGFAVKLACRDEVDTAGAAVWLIVPPVED